VTAELWALVLALPLGQLTTMALPAVVPGMREELGIGYAELGLVLASFGFARMLMNLPAGELTQRFNPRSVLVASLAITLVASALGMFASNAVLVTLARLTQGGASAATQAVVLSWLLGGSSVAFRGRAMGISEASFSLFSLVVPSAAGLLAAGGVGWRAAFGIGAAASLLGLILVLLATRATSATRAFSQAAGEGSWRDVRQGGALLIAVCLCTAAIFYGRQGLIGTLLPLMAGEQLGLPSVWLGVGLSILAVVSIVAVMAGSWTADRVGRRRLLLPGLVLLAICQAAVFLIRDSLGFMLIAPLLGLGYFMNGLPASLVGDALPGRAHARGIVVYRLVADSSWLIGPLVMGLALEHGGFETAKLAVLLPTLGVIGLLLVLSRIARPSRRVS
jgi:MFS transporter, DHA1 family, multidrug resistance protein